MKLQHKSVRFDKKLLDKDALRVIKIIQKAGFDAYLVGGCVRDLLLGLSPKDFDVVTNAKPQQINKLFKRARIIGRRFQLVHVLFSARKFIEVATFRSGVAKTHKSGVILRDNHFGSINEDAHRRDFNINALYYDVKKYQVIDYVGGLGDIKNKQIHIIGDPKARFQEDPVRMIRAIRFGAKLDFVLSSKIKETILNQAHLLGGISPARLYEECIKLFHNEYSLKVYQQLEKYNLLQHLFKQTSKNDFIKAALLNTAERIKKRQSITPAFLFAVFLYKAQIDRFKIINKKQKSVFLATIQASEEVIAEQIKQVSMPRWLSAKVKDIWLMQSKLEKRQPKKITKILQSPNFRIAYDFLLLRSQSINPELKEAAKFWTKAQIK